MQKPIAYYLFLLYAASFCKPLTIWFADAVAHEAFPHQHLQGVHHTEGKAHVHYQIKKTAKDDVPEQKNTAPKAEDDVGVTPYIGNNFCTYTLPTARIYPRTLVQLPAVFLPLDSPPPKAKSLCNIIGLKK